ncbi:MAG: hypothetical protein JWR18_857 [Segetibacter sp.]|jgi:hypothetical protein|nr:hypothetical protein [Segetibacter sp.]
MMAKIAPGTVEFQIHHVVPAFQMNMLSKANKKKRLLFCSLSANNNNGTHAMKMRGVKPASGQAHTNSRPDRTLNIREENFFKKIVVFLQGGKFVKKGIRTG